MQTLMGQKKGETPFYKHIVPTGLGVKDGLF